ncbi:hypothetical protein M409DRAFT_49666 [Zasmidium cellare ATCC 36951]|uniref:Uncharacterized protein n=1 Tax=Zasmidium cellare ATCC 36951 TaxID=1080233 RepID=A0A6A6D1Z0_ZASCE|nr:uncharacterized protein M409DRAFT_49666 [Zasmidium cellare ATCC 36951]KAF2173185.1 hypothetical protein M409DRAFT_49666 [Zasmidium cellare ATCC 36951]
MVSPLDPLASQLYFPGPRASLEASFIPIAQGSPSTVSASGRKVPMPSISRIDRDELLDWPMASGVDPVLPATSKLPAEDELCLLTQFQAHPSAKLQQPQDAGVTLIHLTVSTSSTFTWCFKRTHTLQLPYSESTYSLVPRITANSPPHISESHQETSPTSLPTTTSQPTTWVAPSSDTSTSGQLPARWSSSAVKFVATSARARRPRRTGNMPGSCAATCVPCTSRRASILASRSTWDGKRTIKKEESSESEVGERQFIAQPLYEEQQNQGMLYPAYMNPGDLKLEEGAEFDFNDFHPFPALANEESLPAGDVLYNAVNFHDFLDDATGGHGMIPEGTRHGSIELDVDGLPLVGDYELPGGPTPSPLTAYDKFAEMPWVDQHVEVNPFFMSDFSWRSEGTPLSDQPLAKIRERGIYAENHTRQQILGSLCMAGDEITANGVDIHQLIDCVGEYARLLAKVAETDVKPAFDSYGYALSPDPSTLL